MNLLITICARGGSKGLPGKATKLFNGKPLCQWTMEQALDFGRGDIVVSSDDPTVLNTAHSLDCNYFFRKSYLCQDDTPKLDVLRNAVNFLMDRKYDLIMDLDITNPCRTLEDMNKCVEIFKEKRPETLFSVTKARKNPYFNQVSDYIGDSGNFVSRRQDAPEVYDMNASIYLYDPKWLMNPDNLSPITDKSQMYLMPDWTFCDIDNEIDFTVAEFVFKKYLANA